MLLFSLHTVWTLIKIIYSIPDEESFSETAVGHTVSNFDKIIQYPLWFCNLFEQCFFLIFFLQ